MNARTSLVCALFLLTSSAVAHAQTRATCSRGDCEYHFDDEDVNSPGESAYGQWLTVHPPAKRVLLIRPRVSFVTELLTSAGGV